MRRRLFVSVGLAVLVCGCGTKSFGADSDAGAFSADASSDAGVSGNVDESDAGPSGSEADGGTEVTPFDAGTPDPFSDAGTPESGPVDAGTTDDSGGDAGTGVTLALPPPLPTYSGNACPALVSSPTIDGSMNSGFMSHGDSRSFRLMVPHDYDPSKAYPLVFGWHWLGSSSKSFASQADLESAIEEFQFIAVLPEHKTDSSGNKSYVFEWPFAETWGAPSELEFGDDMLACVSQQFHIDPARIYGMGVSAGALWATYVSGTDRAQHFAAFVIISGGLAEQTIPFTGYPVFDMKPGYHEQDNRFPGMVVWGGALDFLILDFNDASQRLRDEWKSNGHFVITCEHHQGHAAPPFTPPEGHTKLYAIWQFMAQHPYGLPAGTSPWSGGLPDYFPNDSTMTCTIP